MWIMSNDGKSVVKAGLLQVQRILGGKKDAKYAVCVLRDTLGEGIIAAQFADEKTAIDALEKAYRAIGEGALTYRFD
ncbi:MAG: hypothetical protein K2J80_04970 [Oscillospiraceae bacterium]|nr:hypothetical protein [Oscillospiraceae bacterium]